MTTPHRSILSRFQIVSSNDTEVCTSEMHSPKQISVLLLVGFDDRSIGKHDLITSYLVVRKTEFWGEERDTACEM